MKNRWQDEKAATGLQASENPDLELRVYSSRRLGEEPDLVLHGGGNTSVKGNATDVFGDRREVLYVKGSGWDLRTIEAAGFPAVDLAYLRRLGNLRHLSDTEMMRQLRLALLDPTAPTPSVEAILHALIPHKVVDHSHADAVVAISNTPQGEAVLRELYGSRVLILPYIMPGFILARQVAEATASVDWSQIDGIVLLHHGIFTFSDDAKTSYTNMIRLVSMAEDYLEKHGATAVIASGDYQPASMDFLQVSKLRKQASTVLGSAALVRWDNSPAAVGFASLDNVGELANRGPLTPDHTIHAKPFAAIFDQDPAAGMETFARVYQDYFDKFASGEHQCLDLMPRYGVWRNKGLLYFAPNLQRLQIVRDITEHTIKAIQWGEQLGGWKALPRQDLFDVEYWELEQAKLKQSKPASEFTGKVVLVTGAASGIGKACVEEFISRGAVCIALDIAPGFGEVFTGQKNVQAQHCDVTDTAALQQAIHTGIKSFGGLDMVLSNAGSFPASAPLAEMDDLAWNQSLELNLTAHMKLLRCCKPFLEQGIDPAVVIIGSKNVPAPGPGAAAYSVAKAGLTQMSRIAAMELGAAGIRVNVLHPNAVFDTGIWSAEVLEQRASHYGLTVDEYRRNNILKTEVTSSDVAALAAFFAGTGSSVTTGAQIPVDGGNDRVI